MIAGKTEDEIVLMEQWVRSRWYKIILPEEKEKAKEIMEKIRRIKISVGNTGKIHTEGTCAKQSAAVVKLWKDPEYRNGHSSRNNPMYGKTFNHTEETKIKISIALSGEKHPMYGKKGKDNPNFGSIRSEETKVKMRSIWTPERRAECSGENNHNFGRTGGKHPMYGTTHTEEVRAKISESTKGEKHWNWQNGISFEPYGIDFNEELKEQIRKRDNYICQECDKIQEELGCKLDVHHIDYDKQNNNPENLISLCRSCHAQTNFGREEWMKYFKEMIYLKDKELRR